MVVLGSWAFPSPALPPPPPPHLLRLLEVYLYFSCFEIDISYIRFTDIEDINYDGTAVENGKVDYATGMKYMHAVKSDGQVSLYFK